LNQKISAHIPFLASLSLWNTALMPID